MIEPKSNPFWKQDAIAVRARYGLIPSRHVLLPENQVAALSDWFDVELKALENRFRGLMTPRSIRASLRF